MDKTLIKFPGPRKKRVTYKGLLKTFMRPDIKRELEALRDAERIFYPDFDSEGMDWYTARYSGPGEGYRELGIYSLRDLGIGPEILVYRVLRELYGFPDITTVAIPRSARDKKNSQEQRPAFPWEWGFLLKGSSEAFFEIRRQPGTQDPHLAIWVPILDEVDSTQAAAAKSDFDMFFGELKKTLSHSQHLIDKKDLKAKASSIGPLNVYADMLAAGDEQLSAATTLKKRYRSLLPKSDRYRPGPSLGTFYLAAAVNFLLALEGFVNTLSQILRKDEFLADVFDKATVRADFEQRLLSLSLYCDGFARAPFSPNGTAFKHLRQLRAFRNNLLHGNLTRDDHVIYVVPEDCFMLFWWPAADLHEELGPSSFDRLPLSRILFGDGHARAVRKYVEAAIDTIVESLEPDYKKWAADWRRSLLVPALLENDRWVANLKPAKAK